MDFVNRFEKEKNKCLIYLKNENLKQFITCCNKIKILKINCYITEHFNLNKLNDLKKVSFIL